MIGALVHCETQERFALGDRATIGRGTACTIRLDDPMVAAEHCEIARDGDRFELRDCASRSGTFVGRRRVVSATLHDGDSIVIGGVRLRFEVEAAAPDVAKLAAELAAARALGELARGLSAARTVDDMLERVLATCFGLLAADRGIAVICERGARTPREMVARRRDGAPTFDGLSTSVLSQLLSGDLPALRLELDGNHGRSESLRAQGVRSLIAVPIASPETGWLGMIQLDSRADANMFAQEDLETLREIARWAAPALARCGDAHAIQRAALPRLAWATGNLPVGLLVLDEQRRCVVANDWILARATALGPVEQDVAVVQIAGVAIDQLVGENVQMQATVGEHAFHLDAQTDASSRETVVVVTDITEARVRQTRAAHDERLALVGQLAGGIAHDFNNLLSVIVSYAGMLAETALPEQASEDVKGITAAAHSATALVRQLLAFSRREHVAPKVLELGGELTSREKFWRTLVGDGIALSLELPASPCYVLVDPSQLEQVVLNLVVNARDAIDGAGAIAIQVGAPRRREVSIRVSDTGRGIPADIVDRIFEPYFSTKPKSKGTGLGLATVHGIVEHLGGRISVSSTVGRGTTFELVFPTTDMMPETIAEPSKSRGQVLVVDDDDQVRHVTMRMLRLAGYHAVGARGYDEAIARAGEQRFDVVVTDLVMPGRSGREVARDVVRDQPHIRVLYISGYNPGTPLAEESFLSKPFDRAALVQKLASLGA